MKIGDKVFVTKNSVKTNGVVAFIEDKKGFRGYPYRTIHVNIDGTETVYCEWDVRLMLDPP